VGLGRPPPRRPVVDRQADAHGPPDPGDRRDPDRAGASCAARKELPVGPEGAGVQGLQPRRRGAHPGSPTTSPSRSSPCSRTAALRRVDIQSQVQRLRPGGGPSWSRVPRAPDHPGELDTAHRYLVEVARVPPRRAWRRGRRPAGRPHSATAARRRRRRSPATCSTSWTSDRDLQPALQAAARPRSSRTRGSNEHPPNSQFLNDIALARPDDRSGPHLADRVRRQAPAQSGTIAPGLHGTGLGNRPPTSRARSSSTPAAATSSRSGPSPSFDIQVMNQGENDEKERQGQTCRSRGVPKPISINDTLADDSPPGRRRPSRFAPLVDASRPGQPRDDPGHDPEGPRARRRPTTTRRSTTPCFPSRHANCAVPSGCGASVLERMPDDLTTHHRDRRPGRPLPWVRSRSSSCIVLAVKLRRPALRAGRCARRGEARSGSRTRPGLETGLH